MEKTHVLKKPRVFYGYWIVLTAFLLMLVNSGCGYYAFSLYVKSFQTDFGWSRGEIMLAISIFFIVAGVISPFVGRLIDRFGVKKVISIGAFMAGLGFVLLSQLHNLGLFYIGWAVVGVGGAASGQIPTTIIVSNWFKKRRGTAIGIMAIGIGGGGFVLAPIIGGYLIPNFGWRASYFASALLLWVTIPLALLVIKTNPAEMGLYPDGAEAPETEALTSPSVSKGLSPKMALATPAFWLIAVGFILSQAVGAGIVQNQVPYLQDIGFPVTMAAAALGISGLWSAIGKFSFGWLCDRIQAKYAAAIGIALKLVATVILMSVRPTSPVIMIWLYAIFMGLGMGHWLPSMSMLTSTNFGLTYYGAIFGLMSLVQHIGSSIGPSVVGYMYDAMNTYRWAFIMAVTLNGVAIPVILAVRRPKSVG